MNGDYEATEYEPAEYEAPDGYRPDDDEDDGVFMDFSQVHQLRQNHTDRKELKSEMIETVDNPVYEAKEVEVLPIQVFSGGAGDSVDGKQSDSVDGKLSDSGDGKQTKSGDGKRSEYYNFVSDGGNLRMVNERETFSGDLRDSVDLRRQNYTARKQRSKWGSRGNHGSQASVSSEDSPQVERAKVLYAYTAENGDELSIEEGQIVTVLEKELVDSGWWKGELNGKQGVFPDNFVELLPPEEQPKPKRPSAPPASGKPARSSVHKPAPNSPAKHKNNATGATAEARTSVKPTPAPAAATAPGPMPSRKPTMPPPLSKKPGKQQPDPKLIAQTDDHKAKEKTDKDLDAVETTERLSHPTANRAKAPLRRPPSQPGNKDTPGEENNDSLDSPEPEMTTPRGVSKRLSRRAQPPPPPPPPKELPPDHTDEDEEEDDDIPGAEAEPPQRLARPPAPALNNEQPVIKENGGAGEVGAMVSQSELDSIRRELAELRANTVSREEYEQVKREVQQLKEEKEAWQTKHSKLLTDLMEEVDEEKKIRLATEVEMKRIKKMVQP